MVNSLSRSWGACAVQVVLHGWNLLDIGQCSTLANEHLSMKKVARRRNIRTGFANTEYPKLHEESVTVKMTLNYGRDSSLWQTTDRRASCVKGFVLVKGSIARYIRPSISLKRATRALLMKFEIIWLTSGSPGKVRP